MSGSHAGLAGTFTGASITFSGTLTDVNNALADDNISYTPASAFEGHETLTFAASATEEASAGGGTSRSLQPI